MYIKRTSLLYRLGAYTENPLVFIEPKQLQTHYEPGDLCSFTRKVLGGLVLVVLLTAAAAIASVMTLSALVGLVLMFAGTFGNLPEFIWLFAMLTYICLICSGLGWAYTVSVKKMAKKLAEARSDTKVDLEELTLVKFLKKVKEVHDEKICVRLDVK